MLSSVLSANRQDYTEQTLKKFLLDNLSNVPGNPTLSAMDLYLTNRVNTFWTRVAKPLKEKDTFDGNKIKWYFEIYKEGVRAHAMKQNPFVYLVITPENIEGLLKIFKEKTLIDYIGLGTSFLSDAYSLMLAWSRDQRLIKRLETIYASENPLDWILAAEREEAGVMRETATSYPEIQSIMNNIQLVLSKEFSRGGSVGR